MFTVCCFIFVAVLLAAAVITTVLRHCHIFLLHYYTAVTCKQKYDHIFLLPQAPTPDLVHPSFIFFNIFLCQLSAYIIILFKTSV